MESFCTFRLLSVNSNMRAGYEVSREHVGEQANRERESEAADQAVAEVEEERGRDERRDVGVEDGEQHAIEAGGDRLLHAFRGPQFFLDALENQHVRVDAHADRENEAGDARQRHRRAGIRHQAEQHDQVDRDRDERVEARELVIGQHEERHEQQAAGRRVHAGAHRVGAERRADGALFEIGQVRRQRARAQLQAQVLRFLVREVAGDAAFIVDARLNHRRRLDAAVEDDAELAADVVLREGAELARALLVQREADRGTVVLVERRPRVAQVASGDGGNSAEHVVARTGRLAGTGLNRAGKNLHIRRQVVAQRRFRRVLVRERALFDLLQLELRGRSDDFLGARHVGHAGQLHQDLIGGAVTRHDRFGDAELVDAALDRLQRLVDGVLAKLDDDVRLEREGVAAGARACGRS